MWVVNHYIDILNKRIVLRSLICLCLTLLLLPAYNPLFARVPDSLPGKVLFLYDQPTETEDVAGIMQQIAEGAYTDTIFTGPTKVARSAWIYIPGSVLRKDTTRNYVLTGYYDFTDLYKNVNGHWEKVSKGGCYMKFSEESPGAGRYFFRLFDNSGAIADSYLVACRRKNDYTASMMQGELMTGREIKEWARDYHLSKEWFNRLVLPFWGVLFLTTIVLAARFILSRDSAYLMYVIGNVFFILNCLYLYFLEPVNIRHYPFDDPVIGVALSGPFFIMGVGGFILSFRYFYTGGQLLKIAQNVPVFAAILCTLVSVVNFLLSYYYHLFFLTNIIMYAFLTTMILLIYAVLFHYRKILKSYPVTASFLTILYGSLFIAIFSVAGFILSEVYAHNTQYLGKFHLQSFPLLIGIAIYNVFVLVAFSGRDHQLAEEANQLKIKAYEYEIRVLQNSLNPHFIFNSLNLIDFFVYRKDLPRARNALFQFSDLLRMVIDKTTEKSITLTEELKMLELYLRLECSRNMDIFTYSIGTAANIDTDRILIPPLIIQPLAENAIKHGILNKEEAGGHVSIVLSKAEDFLLIEVKDNGIGFKKSSELTSIVSGKRKHLGLELTRRRIQLLSDRAVLEIKDMPEGEGANILIKIPL